MNELETVVQRLKSASHGAPPQPEAASDSASPAKRVEPPVATPPEWLRVASTNEDVPEKDTVTAPPAMMSAGVTAVSAASAAQAAPLTPAASPKPAPRTEPPRETTSGGDGGGKSRDRSPILTAIGAICSIALIAGVSVWTYKLGMRDALEIPVVRAITTPARVPPERPGGRVTAHQGLAVNQVLEGGGVRPVAPKVVTAPGQESLAEEDMALAAVREQAAALQPPARPSLTPELADVTPPPAVNPATEEVAATPLSDTRPTGAASGIEAPYVGGGSAGLTVDKEVAPVRATTSASSTSGLASTEQAEQVPTRRPALDRPVGLRAQTPGLGAAPSAELAPPQIDASPAPSNRQIADVETVAEPADTVTDLAPPDPSNPIAMAALAIPPSGEGRVQAPVVVTAAVARPADIAKSLAAQVDRAVEAAVAATPSSTRTAAREVPQQSIDSIPLPKGTRMVQLGAYDSEAVARREWERFSRQHGDLLSDKSSYVQRTDSSGRIFFRLRVAGYDSGDQTRAACAALSARGVPCMAVTLR